jgi:hypothetical protein
VNFLSETALDWSLSIGVAGFIILGVLVVAIIMAILATAFVLSDADTLADEMMESYYPEQQSVSDQYEEDSFTVPLTDAIDSGSVIGLKGTCTGYTFNITSGEEIIIGKDAKMASIVIETAYKEISRKHVGISYDVIQDLYHVTDYSMNGTWADGQRLQRGVRTIQHHGAVLRLANEKNTFRLG